MEALLDPHDPQSLIAGRRLVRRLGSGRRWTAYSTVLRDGSLPADGPPGPGRPALAADAVLLRARADAAERGLWRRAAILSKLEHPHILRLLDVAEDVGGLPCLLVERLPGGSLAELLRRRGTIAPGEAVTILAPIVDAVRAAHLADIAHGGITPAAVAFAGDGRPVLSGWSDACAVEGPAGRRIGTPHTEPEFVADWLAVGRLVDGVLRATSLGDTADVAAWIAETASGLADHELANRLQQRIHALARPLPVLLDRVAEPHLSAAAAFRSWSDTAADAAAPLTRRAVVAERRQRGLAARARVRIRGARLRRHHRSMDEPAAPTEPATPTERTTLTERTTRPATAARRRRLVLGAVGASVALVTGALLLLPSGDGGSASEPVAVVDPPAAADEQGPASSVDPAEPGPPADAAGQASSEGAVLGSDPVLAAVELGARRDRCRSGPAAESCVLDYAEHGSAFHDAEVTRDAIGPVDPTGLELVDRQGDAAVIRGTVQGVPDDAGAHEERQPVTLLVVRGETGWRLREIFTAA